MDIEAVKALADLLEEKGLSSIEVSEGECKISLKKTVSVGTAASTVLPPAAAPSAAAEEGELDFNGITELKSPMVGVAYVAAEPGAEPFVKVGDRVKKGQVLCVIEAMKLMNEYTAPQDGEIVDICFEDSQLVEFGQCLFKLF